MFSIVDYGLPKHAIDYTILNYIKQHKKAKMYIAVKHAHQTLAIISILGFILRFYWHLVDHRALKSKITKILPHIIDTLLLVAAIILMITINQYPIVDSWLSGKLAGLICYILFGILCFKKAQTTIQKLGFGFAAIASFIYMLVVAITKNPWII
jgi:uncharacterized membrane protein SirB2